MLAIYAVVLKPHTMVVMELGSAGSLVDVLGRSSLLTLGWLQRVALGVGVAAGVECAFTADAHAIFPSFPRTTYFFF